MQLYWVLKHGTFLARRWEEEGTVTLYHCADEARGFFVELRYHAQADAMQMLRSFADTDSLDSYTHGVRLPEF